MLAANGYLPSTFLFFLKLNNFNDNFEIILKHSNDVRCKLEGRKSGGKRARGFSGQRSASDRRWQPGTTAAGEILM